MSVHLDTLLNTTQTVLKTLVALCISSQSSASWPYAWRPPVYRPVYVHSDMGLMGLFRAAICKVLIIIGDILPDKWTVCNGMRHITERAVAAVRVLRKSGMMLPSREPRPRRLQSASMTTAS